LPLGVNLYPTSEGIPLGLKPSFRPSILLNGREWVDIYSRGQSTPLGAELTPSGKLMLL
jgi:hypothetical protein